LARQMLGPRLQVDFPRPVLALDARHHLGDPPVLVGAAHGGGNPHVHDAVDLARLHRLAPLRAADHLHLHVDSLAAGCDGASGYRAVSHIDGDSVRSPGSSRRSRSPRHSPSAVISNQRPIRLPMRTPLASPKARCNVPITPPWVTASTVVWGCRRATAVSALT